MNPPFNYSNRVENIKISVDLSRRNNAGKDVFYVSDDIYELGLTKVQTPMGNKVKAYDMERCICDIIRSKNRMDSEHVKHSIN